MRIKPWLLIGLFLFSLPARGDVEELYRAGKFKEAAVFLQNAWHASEKTSAAIAYNAGTAWAQAGDFARAYFFLLSAERISPFDRDIKNNLSFVREKLPEEAKNIIPVFPLGTSVARLSPVSEYAWGILALLCLAVFLLSRNYHFYRIGRLVLALGCAAFLPFLLLIWENNSPTAIVVQQSKVRSGPAETFSEIRSLPGGAWISVVEAQNGWRKIRFLSVRDKKETVGWINSADLSLF